MSKYYLHLISLANCPYSNLVEELLKNHNYNFKLTSITANLKDNWKTDEINTFPQVYLKRKNSKGSVLLGGYDKMNIIHNIISSITDKNLKENIKKLQKMYPLLSYKSCLRLIKLKN